MTGSATTRRLMLNSSPKRRSRTERAIVGPLMAAVALLLAPTVALAELIVLQSTAPGLKAGAVLKPDMTVEIPSGKSAVFVMPSGATKTMSGPVKQTVADITKGQSSNVALINAVKKYVVTGGTTSSTIGAMRNVSPETRGPIAFALDSVPITVRGRYCLIRGAPTKLVRSRTDRELAVTIVAMGKGKRGKSSFAAGQSEADWPSGVTVSAGDFAIAAPGRALRKVTIHLLDQRPADDQVLPALFAAKCESQIKAFVKRGN